MEVARKWFRKEEKLCSQKTIDALFERGNIFYAGVLKVIWKADSAALPSSAKAAFSAPKKAFKHAVTRNLIKRRMREAYRNNKHLLNTHIAEKNITVSLFFILSAKTVPDYKTTEKSMTAALNKLIKHI